MKAGVRLAVTQKCAGMSRQIAQRQGGYASDIASTMESVVECK